MAPDPRILLLHGALGAGPQLQPLRDALGDHAQIVEFSGHGATPYPADGAADRLESDVLVQDVRRVIGDTPVVIFGHSMGGLIACQLARRHPELVERLVTFATIFRWDQAVYDRESVMLDPDVMLAKVPGFAGALEARHTAIGWRNLCTRSQGMLQEAVATGGLGPTELGEIGVPVRVVVGDRDVSAGVEPTVAAWRALPDASLEVLPGVGHPIERAPLDRLVRAIRGE